eukprot:6175364-Pyramimonas_sp.AAC.1
MSAPPASSCCNCWLRLVELVWSCLLDQTGSGPTKGGEWKRRVYENESRAPDYKSYPFPP